MKLLFFVALCLCVIPIWGKGFIFFITSSLFGGGYRLLILQSQLSGLPGDQFFVSLELDLNQSYIFYKVCF